VGVGAVMVVVVVTTGGMIQVVRPNGTVVVEFVGGIDARVRFACEAGAVEIVAVVVVAVLFIDMGQNEG